MKKIMNNKSAGELIKFAREFAGLSQKEVSLYLGISDQFLGRIELGHAPLPLEHIPKLKQKLKILSGRSIKKALIDDYKKSLNSYVYRKH